MFNSLNPFVKFCFFVFWVISVIAFGAALYGEMETERELTARLAIIQANITEQTNREEQMRIELELFDSETYMETLARRRGMVRPNEIIFRNTAE